MPPGGVLARVVEVAALDQGERTGVDWPDHCMRLLPADETAMAELEAEDAAEVAP